MLVDAPVISRVPPSITMSEPLPSGLFTPAFATAGTLTVPPLRVTLPLKLFVVEIVTVAAPDFTSAAVPVIPFAPETV